MRDRLLTAVHERLARYATERDSAILLDAGAGREAAALAAIADADPTDLEARHAAGWLSWYRHLARLTAESAVPGHDAGPGHRDGAAAPIEAGDLSLAVRLLTRIHAVAPGRTPDTLRAYLDAPMSGTRRLDVRADQAVFALNRALRRRDTDGLALAIRLFRAVRDEAARGSPRWGAAAANLVGALRTRAGWSTSASRSDLEEAVTIGTDLLDGLGDDDLARPAALANVGGALETRYALLGRVDDLDRAIELTRLAVAAAAGRPERARYLSNLGAGLRTRYGRTGDHSDLVEAVGAAQEAVAATTAADPEWAGRLANLGSALFSRYGRDGDRADLAAAVEASQRAVDATVPNHPERGARLTNLSVGLRQLATDTGERPLLDEAVRTSRLAVAATAAQDSDLPGRLSNLSAALESRYRAAGERRDLDEALGIGRRALAATPAGHPGLPGRLTNLGLALRERFAATGNQADIEQAVEMLTRAVGLTPDGHPDRAAQVSNLSGVLRTRFGRTGSRDDLERAVESARSAVLAAPATDPDRHRYLANLGGVLRDRFGRSVDRADIDEAITATRAAVRGTPPRSLERAAWLTNLAVILRERSGITGERPDLDEAVEVGREAVAVLPDGHPDRASAATNLGLALRDRFRRGGAPTDLEEACAVLADTARRRTAVPRVRAGAARTWGRLAAQNARWSEATEAYAVAVEQLGLMAPRAVTRSDQEFALGSFAGMASAAAACSLRAGDVDRALELWEQGRGVLLGQALDLRADLRVLESTHPALAGRFVAVRAALEREDPPLEAFPAPAVDPAAGPLESDRRLAIAAEFDQVVADIRATPGFAAFLRPPRAADLRAIAASGPIVVVNCSPFGSDALIVTVDGIAVVALPALDAGEARERTETFLTALAAPGRENEGRLAVVLSWLWDTIAEPVLTRLGISGPPPPGEPWPRVWWCVSGPLAFLPLHAAGHHVARIPDGQPAAAGPASLDAPPSAATATAVIDRVVSSYTPTLRALDHARRSAAGHRSGVAEPALVVAMPRTPGPARDLPKAAEEARVLTELIPGTVTIAGERATHDAVLAALPGHAWVHFACHAQHDPADPSGGGLLLHGAPGTRLTVLDVSRLRLDSAGLAFLSACSTARSGSAVPDEAIHLAAAFQLAGYPTVIATLWEIRDRHAPRIAADTYARMLAGAGFHDAAVALHHAVRDLRLRRPGSLSFWAAYLHSGV